MSSKSFLFGLLWFWTMESIYYGSNKLLHKWFLDFTLVNEVIANTFHLKADCNIVIINYLGLLL